MPNKKKKTKTTKKKKEHSDLSGYYWDGVKTTILRQAKKILSI